jgi:hypothetical protein
MLALGQLTAIGAHMSMTPEKQQEIIEARCRTFTTKIIMGACIAKITEVTTASMLFKQALIPLLFTSKAPCLALVIKLAHMACTPDSQPFTKGERTLAHGLLSTHFLQLKLKKCKVTPKYTCQIIHMKETDPSKNIHHFLQWFVIKLNIQNLLRSYGCKEGNIQTHLGAMLSAITETLLIPYGHQVSIASPAPGADGGGGGGKQRARPRPVVLQTHGLTCLQNQVTRLAELTVENVARYQLVRTQLNERLAGGNIEGKQSPGGKFTYDDKMLASGAFLTYIRQPLAKRNFDLLIPHLEACRDGTLKRVVAIHAQVELELCTAECFEFPKDLDAVNSWFDFEAGARQPKRAETADEGAAVVTAAVV